jgi:predicted dehydrogenase
MRKIRIAQIGTSINSHGRLIWESIVKQSDIFEVIGYALPENEREKFPEQVKSFGDYPELSVEEILNNPEIEAVTVETEEIYLTKYAQMVADAKKHIHMEKPGGTEPATFERLIDTVKSNGTVFHTGYMYRYNPYIIELIDQVKNGELGDIISVEAQMNCIHPKGTRQWLENFPGGMMFFLGCHLIDLILQIQGKPERVIPMNKCSGVDGVTSKDFGFALFEYKNGVSFAKTSAVELGGFERRQLVVTGTKKTVELKPLEWYVGNGMLETSRYEREHINWGIFTQKETCEPFDRYDAMMLGFASMVRGEKENPWSYDYELELYKTVLKACGK